MTEFSERYKKYIIPAILLFIYLVFTFITWGRWGNVIFDCFREAIIPQAMLDGKVLYTDITCIYPPLAYQFNALLFKIFGNSLNVLYSLSVICGLTILALLYKIAEKKSSLLTTFVLILTIMEIFTFRIVGLNSASWYFPYSYSFLYAFTLCIIAFYLYILYKDTNEKKYLYLSTLAAGFSVACKFDFLLFILLVIYEIIKNKSFKDFGYCLLLFFAPLFCSYGIWFLTGGSIDGLVQYKDFLVNFANAPSVKVFNETVLMQSFSEKIPVFLFNSVCGFGINILKILCLSAVFLLISKKFSNKIVKALFYLVLGFLGYVFILKNISLNQLVTFNLHYNLVFVPYVVIISAIVILLLKIREKNYTEKEKFYFLVAAAAFLMSYRVFMAVFIAYIGNFIMVVYWLAFLYLLFELLPEYFPALNKDFYKKLVCLTLVLYGFSYTMVYLSLAEQKNMRIEGRQEAIYTTSQRAKVINEVISYFKEYSSEKDTVLIADEGLVVNYFADRKTNMKYYALIPHMIDTYGEDKIISDLLQNPPEYFVVTNNLYPLAGFWGTDYGQNIMNFVSENYNQVRVFEEKDAKKEFRMTIYKKQEKK